MCDMTFPTIKSLQALRRPRMPLLSPRQQALLPLHMLARLLSWRPVLCDASNPTITPLRALRRLRMPLQSPRQHALPLLHIPARLLSWRPVLCDATHCLDLSLFACLATTATMTRPLPQTTRPYQSVPPPLCSRFRTVRRRTSFSPSAGRRSNTSLWQQSRKHSIGFPATAQCLSSTFV